MGINEKIAKAKKTKWVVEGMSEAHIKTTVELARISARIEKCRLDMGMTQQEFAEYMGVSQAAGISHGEHNQWNYPHQPEVRYSTPSAFCMHQKTLRIL